MYEDFYGLKEKPFSLTPDPKFLFLSRRHMEAMEHLSYGITQRHGFVLITGDVGTGKTTICRALLNRLDEETSVAFLLNPFFSEEELLRNILTDFGVHPSGKTKLDLTEELYQFLINNSSSGITSVLIIDEAQNLSFPVLEQIRILSNLETEKEKLLQIVLVGQEELQAKLALDRLRQLDQRISVRYHLKQLEEKDIPKYIYHRLTVAGAEGRISFSKYAIKRIARYSQGIPRLINLISDRSLLSGYTKQKYHINAGMVSQAVKSLYGSENTVSARRLVLRVKYPILFITVFLFMGTLFYFVSSSELMGKSGYSFFTKNREKEDGIPPRNVIHFQEITDIIPKGETYEYDDEFPFTIYVDSFPTREEAMQKVQELQHVHFPVFISKFTRPGKSTWYRVLIGKFKTPEETFKVYRDFKKRENMNQIRVIKAVADKVKAEK